MSHKIKFIDYQKISDGQYVLVAQCCEDPDHISKHTMDAVVIVDDQKRENSINVFVARMAIEHEAALAADAHKEKLVGTVREHDGKQV